MTAQQAFDRTLLLMFASPEEAADYQSGFITALNMTLENCFDVENGLRWRDGKKELAAPQQVAALAETIDCHWKVCAILPYSCAGILMAEDDISSARSYQNQYQYEKQQLVQYRFEEG